MSVNPFLIVQPVRFTTGFFDAIIDISNQYTKISKLRQEIMVTFLYSNHDIGFKALGTIIQIKPTEEKKGEKRKKHPNEKKKKRVKTPRPNHRYSDTHNHNWKKASCGPAWRLECLTSWGVHVEMLHPKGAILLKSWVFSIITKITGSPNAI